MTINNMNICKLNCKSLVTGNDNILCHLIPFREVYNGICR